MPFDGFISYSHAADGRLAPAVQRGLHRLAKPWHRRRALWIFRDQTGLAVTPALWSSIQVAMDGSKHFVLLASPEAARSPWVNREIEHWVATKSPDQILPVVTDGEWRWDAGTGDFTADSTAVPAALRGVFAEEPLYLDLRWARTDVHLSLQHTRFRDAVAQLAAPMHGVSKDELEGEDVRTHRRTRLLSVVVAAALVLLALVASLTGIVATRNATRATAAAADARLQQQVATEQRTTAVTATQESQRQQEIALVQEVRARDATAETRRQTLLAGQQRALAADAAAEAKREQANAKRYEADAAREKANAEQQQANAERQQAAAGDASEEVKRQQAAAERQLANARQQQELARQATERAELQERLAKQYGEEARKADKERQRQQKLAQEADKERQRQERLAREAAEKMALQQRIAISRRLTSRARGMVEDDPKKALMLGAAAESLYSDAETGEKLSHLVMSTHYLGTVSDVLGIATLAGRVFATTGAGGTVSLWDTADPAQPVRLARLPIDGTTAKTLATSPDGRTLAVFDGGSEATLWDLRNPASPLRMAPLSDPAGIVAVTFSPDGHTVATSNRARNSTLWTTTGTAPAPLTTLPAVSSVQFSPDGRTMVTSGNTVLVWNLTDPAHPVRGATLANPWELKFPDAEIAYNPERPVVAVVGAYDVVTLWDLTDPAQPVQGSARTATVGETTLESMEFSSDGATLAFGGSDGTTVLWSLDTEGWEWLPTQVANLVDRGGPVRSIAFSQDGRTVITAGGGHQAATLWTTRDRFGREKLAALPGPYPGRIAGLAFAPDGRTLFSGHGPGTTLPWDVTDPARPVRRDPLPLRNSDMTAIALSRDGHTLAATGSDKTVTLVDVSRPGTPVPLATIPPADDVVNAAQFSPDGRTLAVGSRGGTTTVWDLADRTGPVLLATFTFRGNLLTMAFSPDGNILALHQSSTVTLWDLTNRSAPARLASIPVTVSQWTDAEALAFSPDGRTLAAGGVDNNAQLWDIADPVRPNRISILMGHSSPLRFAAFTPDGRTLVTGSKDDALIFWDITEPAVPVRFATLDTPELQNVHVALSPDGHTVAAGATVDGLNETLTLWDTTIPEDLAADPLGHACGVSGRGLNEDEWRRYIPELPYQATCR